MRNDRHAFTGFSLGLKRIKAVVVHEMAVMAKKAKYPTIG
jgi:hypothetical protein